jgi:hypothetical protein
MTGASPHAHEHMTWEFEEGRTNIQMDIALLAFLGTRGLFGYC